MRYIFVPVQPIAYLLSHQKMIGKTQATSILTNNISDHVILVGPHTAASEILVELVMLVKRALVLFGFEKINVIFNPSFKL